jgi:tape measure domain-containing protein|tara:strand:- start:571 stop:2307 length:1737 start_codon:yes stop_codon:yes gene_type:complete
MALGKSTYQIVLETNLKSNNAFKNVNKNVDQINNKLKTLRNTLVAAFGIRELVRASDQFTNLNNKLAALTGSTELAAQGFNHVLEISRAARADLESTGDLFAKITFATQEMGLSLDDVAKATQTVANTFAIAGADTIATANASRQLAQGLASGTLRGDELNSVMEQNEILAHLLAKGLGVTVGKLRDMGAAGQITAKKIMPILIAEFENTNKTVAGMTITIGQSVTILRNKFTELVGEGSRLAPINELIARSVVLVADNIEKILIPVMAILAAKTIPALTKAVIALNVVIRANPFVAIASTIMTVIGLYALYHQKLDQTVEKNANALRTQIAVNEQEIISHQNAIKRAEEAAQLSDMQAAIEATNIEERKRLIQGLIDKNKELLIALEGITTELEKDPKGFLATYKDAVDKFVDDAGAASNTLMESFSRTFTGLEDIFTNFFKTGKLRLKDFVNLFLSELGKIIARALVLNILTGGKAKAFSDLGSLFKERGGTVSANKPYIVGERGAEVFVPNKTGTIISNQNLKGSGGSAMPVNITYNIQAFDSKDTIAAITENAPTISAIIESEFNKRGNRGFVT